MGVVCLAALLLAAGALTATALTEERGPRGLARLRLGCCLASALLVAASLPGFVTGVALLAAGLALLLSLHAVWLGTRRPLRSAGRWTLPLHGLRGDLPADVPARAGLRPLGRPARGRR
jgi:hypothetical protein